MVASLERLTSTPQNNIPNVAAYNYSRNTHHLRHQQYQRGQTKSSGLQHDSDLLAKLVRDEVRRQTSFMTPPSRPSNSGVPSARNRRTTDGLPICNKCNKVGVIVEPVLFRIQQVSLTTLQSDNMRKRFNQIVLPSAPMHLLLEANQGLPTHFITSSQETSPCFSMPGR